jgi:hypothetical protein
MDIMRKCLLVLMALWLPVSPARATPPAQILDNLQQLGFNYFWTEANPSNGMIRDRNTSGSPCSIAAVGFGLSSICIGIDHGWITRAQGQTRVLTTLNTFWNGPQGSATSGTMGYHGFFYHFLDMSTGLRMPGWNPELSDIDTALLLAGILDCKQYFNTADPNDVQIRTLADQIYQRVDWTFFRNSTASPPGLMIQWTPESGFNTGVWKGYNEMMIMYLLAIGSPTHPIPATDWNTFTSGYVYGTQYGQTYVQYGALFTHQYSHCWIDFRNKRDVYMQGKGLDYFENSRRATLAQQAYCIANPGPKGTGFPDPAGYSATLWGLTACDGPTGYAAHGAPGPGTFDDGTIAPTAAIGSLPFAADICVPTIQNIFDSYPSLWGTYGLKDAFNLARSPDWYDTDFLGIDQGPIVMMIENYRSGSVWSRFMQNAEITSAMAAAGFVSVVGVNDPSPSNDGQLQLRSGPNPFTTQTTIRFELPHAARVRLTVHDVTGREVARLLDGWADAGQHAATLRADHLPSGVYWYHLDTGEARNEIRGVLMR